MPAGVLLIVLLAAGETGADAPPAGGRATAESAGEADAAGEVDATADEEPAAPPGSRRPRSIFAHLGRDAHYLVTFPKRRTRRGVVAASAVAGGLATLMLLDDEIRREVQQHRSPGLDRWQRRFEPLGSAELTFAGAALLYGAGSALEREPLAETGRSLLEALILTEVFVKGLKGLTGRQRPGPDGRSDVYFEDLSGIFPSGHTARAFAVASVLAQRYGRRAAWVGYPLATLVGLSVIENDWHWASDVLAGAAIGYGVGKTVSRLRARRQGRSRAGRQLTVLPAVSPARGRAAVMVQLTW